MVPSPTDGTLPPTPVCAEPHVDGCGRCLLNYEEPRTHKPIRGGGCVCSYSCTDCGFTWATNYGGRA